MSVTPADRARVEEILRQRPGLRKAYEAPTPPYHLKKRTVQITPVLSDKMTEAVKANPESLQVRLSAEAADGTTVVERARRTEVLEVIAVDNKGRPSLARRHDVATNEWTTVEFDQGYRRSGVVSDYNPLDALKRGDE